MIHMNSLIIFFHVEDEFWIPFTPLPSFTVTSGDPSLLKEDRENDSSACSSWADPDT